MRIVLVIILLALTPYPVIAQDADRVRQADEVKQAVGKVAGSKKTKAQIVLRDLRELEGKIVGVYVDSFVVTLKEKNKALITIGSNRRNKPTLFLKYSEVLQLEGKGVLLSFVPDPMQSPYSSWDTLRTIGAGEFLQIDLTNGKSVQGTFFRCSDDKLTLIRGNTEMNISRENVARVYRVQGDTSTLVSKLFGGAQKGAKITDSIFPIQNPSARALPGALALGAAIGSLIYILPRGKTTRVLAFAK